MALGVEEGTSERNQNEIIGSGFSFMTACG